MGYQKGPEPTRLIPKYSAVILHGDRHCRESDGERNGYGEYVSPHG
jgi:hypothetical protein